MPWRLPYRWIFARLAAAPMIARAAEEGQQDAVAPVLVTLALSS